MSVMWTIVPPERLFGDGEGARYTLWRHMGRLVRVEEDGRGGATVAQLLSTDPADFLDPSFAPGKKLWQGGRQTH